MKSRFVTFVTWVNSDPRRVTVLLVGAMLTLAVSGVAHAGPMPGGSDVIRP